MNDLSVIIITRNRLEKLKRCIDSLKMKLSEAEIIVVDNGSNDGTVKYFKNNHGIKLIALDSNIGVAGGRNAGLERCSSSFTVFIDDDAWIENLDFTKVREYFISHPDVGIIAPRILYPNGDLQESIRSFPTLSALLWRGTGLYKLFPNVSWYRRYINNNTSNIHSVDWAIGACLIIRRELIDSIGHFDKRFSLVYDDVDYCYRARKADYLTVYWPDACIYHEYTRISSKGFNIDLWRHIKSIIRFFLKKTNWLS